MIKSYPSLKKGDLQQVAQDHVWLGFKYLLRWKYHSFSGKPLLVFDHAYNKKPFSYN